LLEIASISARVLHLGPYLPVLKSLQGNCPVLELIGVEIALTVQLAEVFVGWCGTLSIVAPKTRGYQVSVGVIAIWPRDHVFNHVIARIQLAKAIEATAAFPTENGKAVLGVGKEINFLKLECSQ